MHAEFTELWEAQSGENKVSGGFSDFSGFCVRKKIDMDKETILRKVKNVLEQVRPYLQQDGGDVNFVELTDDNTVIVELTGACGNCPHSKMTLKNGIESVMKKAIPEIKAVEQADVLEL